MLLCDSDYLYNLTDMKENFIRMFDGPFTKEQSQSLINEFESIEDKSTLSLTLDGTNIGETAYIEDGTDAQRILIDHVSNIVAAYIQELGVPYNFKRLMDEGYQIQRWDAASPHWLSTIDSLVPNRALQVLVVLQAKKGASIKFRHHDPTPLKANRTIVFPALFTHSYILNSVAEKGIYLISTSVKTLGLEEE